MENPETEPSNQLSSPVVDLRFRISREHLFYLLSLLLLALVVEILARGMVAFKRQFIDPQTVICDHPYSDLCPYERDWNKEHARVQFLDTQFGWALLPDFRGEFITTNGLGFRGPAFAPQKPDSAVRIALLGGSAVFGQGVYDNETIPYYLQSLYDTRTDCQVEVINSGFSAITSTQESVILQHKLLTLEPDIVVVYDGFNEVYFATSANWDPVYSPAMQRGNDILRGENPTPWHKSIWDWLRGHSVVLQIAHQVITQALGIQGNLTRAEQAQLTTHPKTIDVYTRNLRLMALAAQLEDVKLIVVVQPVIAAGAKTLTPEEEQILAFRQGFAYFEPMMSQYGRLYPAAASVADAYGFPAFDYTGVFNSVSETLYLDEVHVRPAGNRIVAEQLFKDLSQTVRQAGCEF